MHPDSARDAEKIYTSLSLRDKIVLPKDPNICKVTIVSDLNSANNYFPGPAVFMKLIANLAKNSWNIGTTSHNRQSAIYSGAIDPLNIGETFFGLTRYMLNDPAKKLIEAWVSLW